MTNRARVLTFAAVGALAAAGAQGQADAAQLEQSGWWTSVPVTAPTAPAGTLLVQGGPDVNTPIAYAGVSFTLSDGETPTALTLTVNTNGGNTPNAKLQLCKASGAINGDAGGDAANGPKYDCTTNVAASASADGSSYEFKDVGSLADAGSFAVAVLPTQPTDRVVLNKPDGAALKTESSGSSSSSDPSTDSSFTSSDPSALGSGSSSFGGSSGGTGFDAGPTPLPSVSGGDDTSRSDSSTTRLPTAAPAQNIASQQPASGGRSMKPWIFGGIAAAAAALWTLAGRVSDGDLAEMTTETD